jgi:hypothetical protein
LGRFYLHYHEFFLPKDSGDRWPAPPGKIWQLIAQWIEEYSRPSSLYSLDAWHPYVISRRIPVWVKLFSVHPPNEPIAGRVLSSLTAQARWLAKNLEFDLGGNHLVQNLRALAVAGAFFDGAEASCWLHTVEKLLPNQCREQILPAGEHFERSPMYHVDMLLSLVDVWESLRACGQRQSDSLEKLKGQMAVFLEKVLHPDGQIPLFGDSTLDLTPSPEAVLGRLGRGAPELSPAGPSSEQVGDYWLYRHEGKFVIFDAGPVGPDHLPAHAHADLLGVEASWNGRRLFVDAGVFDYEESPQRSYCRSTTAHNTLEVDGANQCDVWSRFRMGRRGWPGKLVVGEAKPFRWAWCTHNAYRHLGVPRVGRLVVCIDGGPWVIVDVAAGRGRHRLLSRLRVGPGWSTQRVDRAKWEIHSSSGRVLVFSPAESGSIEEAVAWYYPHFGEEVRITELVQQQSSTLPAVFYWVVAGESDLPVALTLTSCGVVMRFGDAERYFPILDWCQ